MEGKTLRENVLTGNIPENVQAVMDKVNPENISDIVTLKEDLTKNISKYEERISNLKTQEKELFTKAQEMFGIRTKDDLSKLFEDKKVAVSNAIVNLNNLVSSLRNVYQQWDPDTKEKFPEVIGICDKFEQVKSSLGI